MISERIAETVAMLAIGDGLLCAVRPEQHTGLWLRGPDWWRRTMEPFVDHPNVTRVLGLAGIGFGVWLASRQWAAADREAAGRGAGALGRAARRSADRVRSAVGAA